MENWRDIENELDFEEILFNQTKIIVSNFCKKIKNVNETFYAFAFDLEIEQEHFGLCLNSVETLNLTKREFEDRSDHFNEDEFEEAFNTGNWKYQSFNMFEFPLIKDIWNSKMKSIISAIHLKFEEFEYAENTDDYRTGLADKIHEGFISSVEKVVNRIKSENIFECLKTTDNFRVYFLEFHDEFEDEIIKKRVKNAATKA